MLNTENIIIALKTSKKSAIYLPYAKELPVELLAEIVKWCLGN